MSNLSTDLCCQRDELVGRSLVDVLIEIDDRYGETNEKSMDWVENLKCLSVVRGSSTTLRETRVEVQDMNAVRNYIAVSYSCKAMEEYESSKPEGYKIIAENGKERKNKVRDIVISRVRRFAEHAGSSLFWIDKECVDPTEQQAAMDSMDRVYNKSRLPIGLISTEIRDESHVCSLASLLYGDLRSIFANGDNETITGILDLLELLQKDRWWQRAWIFQEEYLGGERMILLIRHTQNLELLKQEAFATHSESGEGCFIDGEICFPATLLREQTTWFLLALRDDMNVPTVLRKRCKALPSCFSKYNILYDETEANGRAMSTVVFRDIAARGITQPYDIIPITANCCNYGTRLDSQLLAEERPGLHSIVGLSALTMFLVNGELIRDAGDISRLPTTMTTPDYLEYISFCTFDPPFRWGQLTWLKKCRLPGVSLHKDGIHTVGLIWKVYGKFGVAGWELPKRTCKKQHNFGLKPHQHNRLAQFAAKLRAAEGNRPRDLPSLIPEKIEKYLYDDLTSRTSNPVKDYKDTMAREIVNAIDGGEQTLSLAVLEGSEEAFAIFVGPQDEGEDARIFTSWSSRYEDDNRHRTLHVSLKVKLLYGGTPPLMRYTEWVNGLTFWDGHEQEDVVFCWPPKWEEIQRSR